VESKYRGLPKYDSKKSQVKNKKYFDSADWMLTGKVESRIYPNLFKN